MRIKVSDILNYDRIVTKVAEAKSYRKMLGQSEVMELTFENDIGEPGEIYESVVFQCCYCEGHMSNGCRFTNTESKHVKTDYIPDWIMYVHMSGVEVEELWVQPSEHI